MSTEKHLWDLNRLHTFVEVARSGSLKAASLKLGMAQPAISRQMARLETECKGRLFERTGRGMVLTELGSRMLPLVERILSQADTLTESVASAAGMPFGDVRIGMLPSLYRHIGVPLFFAARKHYPGVRLQFFEGSAGQIDQWLGLGTLDIGLPYRYESASGPDGDAIISADSCLVGPSGDRITAADTVPFKALHELPLILPSAPSGVRTTLDRVARQLGIALNIVVEADSTQLQTTIVAKGGAYTVLPELAITDFLVRGELQAARIVDPVVKRRVTLAMSSAHPPSYAARCVAKLMKEIVENSAMLRMHRE